jgi:hypothetical protein
MNDLLTLSDDAFKPSTSTPPPANLKKPFTKQKNSEPHFEELLEGNPSKMPSIIQPPNNNDSSLFFQNSHSFVLANLEEQSTNIVDEYVNDDDVGFELYEVQDKDFAKVAKKLAEKYGFPGRACVVDHRKKKSRNL